MLVIDFMLYIILHHFTSNLHMFFISLFIILQTSHLHHFPSFLHMSNIFSFCKIWEHMKNTCVSYVVHMCYVCFFHVILLCWWYMKNTSYFIKITHVAGLAVLNLISRWCPILDNSTRGIISKKKLVLDILRISLLISNGQSAMDCHYDIRMPDIQR